jgi:hypothetical protein
MLRFLKYTVLCVLATFLHGCVPMSGDLGHTAPPRAPGIVKVTPAAHLFGHALVPGGIHTLAELAAHAYLYPGLDLDSAVLAHTVRGFFAYVNYMKDGHIYWSKRPRYIPYGEAIITDGNIFILQACGNEFKLDPGDPADTLLDEPLDIYPADTIPGDIVLPDPPTPEEETTFPIPTIVFPTSADITNPNGLPSASLTFGPGIALTFPPEHDPTPTPEPSAGLALAVGLGVILMWSRF